MKKHEIIFSTIKVPLDFCIVFGSFFLAREIRLVTDLIPSVQLPIQTINTSSLIIFALLGAMLHILLFSIHGLYSSKLYQSKIKEFLDIIGYSLYWFIFFSVGIYLGNGILYTDEIPRLIIAFTLIASILFIILERIILNSIQNTLLHRGVIPKRKIILITNTPLKKIQYILKDIKASGIYTILGYIGESVGPKSLDPTLTYLGGKKEFHSLLRKGHCDEVLYIDSDFSKKALFDIWDLTRIYGVRYRYITNSFDITSSNSTISLINTIPVIELENTPLGIWGRVLKRGSDIAVSVILLLLLSPILIIIWAIIKFENPKAPAIYKNLRVGKGGKVFPLYKFRYMDWKYCTKQAYGVGTESDSAIDYESKLIKKQSSRKGPLYKIQDDPRVTQIGIFLEKYSLDELPQLVNVLRGQMSLVGPRPHQPREVHAYKLEDKRLLTIKPGITGMAQVNGREKNNFADEAKLDIFYIENWSLILDLKILLKTFTSIIRK